ncbi:MAG: rhodanese-like domain-containing protein [Evtepia gabavorous]
MGILSHLFCIDINRGVRNYQATPGAVLLDVRSRESYARKRIPESRNLPLEELSRAKEVLPDLSVPLFVYAYGGETSARAVSRLKDMGYTQVHDIGGLKSAAAPTGIMAPPRAPAGSPPLARCAPARGRAQTGNRILTPDSDAGEASEW